MCTENEILALALYVFDPVETLQCIWEPYEIMKMLGIPLGHARAVGLNNAFSTALRLQAAGFSVAVKVMPGDVDYCRHHWCSMNRAWVSEQLAIHEGRQPRPFLLGVLSN